MYDFFQITGRNVAVRISLRLFSAESTYIGTIGDEALANVRLVGTT